MLQTNPEAALVFFFFLYRESLPRRLHSQKGSGSKSAGSHTAEQKQNVTYLIHLDWDL